MSVIQPVQMVEICFMNERVSPNRVHESAKYEESSRADRCESYRLRVHKDIDASDYSGEHPSRLTLLTVLLMFHANDSDARHSVDNWIYLPMCAKSEHGSGPIPPPPQGAEKCEKHQESEYGLGGPSRGNADDNRVQKVEGHQEGGTASSVVLRYRCWCCIFAANV
jgi:hypothetical protein